MNMERCFLNLYRAEVRYYGRGRRLMNIDRPVYSFHRIKAGSCFDDEGRGCERKECNEAYTVMIAPGESKIVEGTSGMFLRIPTKDCWRELTAEKALELARKRSYGLGLVGRG